MSVETSSSPPQPELQPSPEPSASTEGRPKRATRSIWRPEHGGSWWRSRWVRRIATTGLFAAIVAALVWLVFPPLYHPTAQMVFLTGGNYRPLRAPPAAFALDDFNALEPIGGLLTRQVPEDARGPVLLTQMKSAAEMRRLSAALAEVTPDSTGVLIVYVDGHGVSDGGAAYLLCQNYDPANPGPGRFALDDLLKQLERSPAPVKLLILDTGRIESDPQAGMMVNEFPRLLEQAVEQSGDPSLWVLTSNAMFERSHVSEALERSVFGYFVSQGLDGAADLDGNRTINVGELARYVRANVAAWVHDATAGHETQTPLLLWGGGAELPRELPVILPAGRSEGAGFKLPAKKLEMPDIPGNPATAYTNRAQNDFVPVSRDAQKKVPGMRAARKARKVNKQASRLSGGHSGQASLAPGESPGGAGAKAANDAKSSADAPATPTRSVSEAAGPTDAKSGDTAKPVPPAPPTAAESLAEGWQLRDDLDAPGDEPRPVDYAPQTWREYQEWLLAQERLYRAGELTDPKELAATLQKTLVRLSALPNVPPLEADKAADLPARLQERRPQLPNGVGGPHSLAMAAWFASRGGEPLSADARAALQSIDRLTQSGTAAEFTAWIAKLSPALDRYSEVRWARQLSKLPNVDWSVVQLALGTRRLAEQATCVEPAFLPWVRERLENADRLRLTGERLLTDSIATDRQARATSLLHQAADEYHDAADDATQIAVATQLCHDVLNRAPYYVAWRRAAGLNPPQEAPSSADVLALLKAAGELDAALATADRTNFDLIAKLAAEVAALVDRVELGLDDANVAALTGKTPAPGSGWRIEALLSTPLPALDTRSRLLAAIGDDDTRRAANYRPARVPEEFEPPPEISDKQWEALIAQAKLDLALAQLAAGDGPNERPGATAGSSSSAAGDTVGRASRGTPLSSDGMAMPIERALAELIAAQAKPGNEARFAAARKFGEALADFYHNLPHRAEAIAMQNADLTDPALRPGKLKAIRNADRMARLIDVRDMTAVESTTAVAGGSLAARPPNLLAIAGLYDLLAFQQRRLETAAADAPAADAEYLADAAAAYRADALRVPLEPPLGAAPVVPLEIAGPTALDLTADPDHPLELTVRSTATQPIDIWLLLSYSTDAMDVQTSAASGFYREAQFRAAALAKGSADATAEDVAHPDRLGLAPSLRLRPGESQTVRCRIVRQPEARNNARLIVKAIAAGGIVRHETEIELPPPSMVELAVDGPAGCWSQTESRLTLFPFPNRKTAFRLSLANHTAADRTVDVELLALDTKPAFDPPPAPLTPADAASVLGRFGSLKPVAALAKIVVPAGGQPVALPFPMPAGEKQEEPPKTPPPRIDLSHGLLVVVTDRQSQLKTIERVEIDPQRPRRYVEPRVSYSVDHELLQIRVVPRDKGLLPAGGVKVHADFAKPLPAGTQAQLDGEINEPDYAANLFAEVPAVLGKKLTLRLTVDGYPREFVYHVPCGVQSSDVPEETDLREIRILSPSADKAFKAPVDVIPVVAEVDAPVSAFQNPDDVLEIGIDVDRDRDLQHGEPSVKLLSERQVAVLVDSLAPEGVVTLDAEVTDFHLNVPAPALTNARVDVLGRLFAVGKTGWSQPVPIVLDGAPPKIERVHLLPAVPVIGPDVEVSVEATDDNLSGVAKVEAAFDPTGHGKFDQVLEPVELFRDAEGAFTAKLTTKNLPSGDMAMLVRATDMVGNVSDYTKVKVHVITKAEADAKAAQPGHLAGTVTFGGQGAAGVQVMLSADKGPKIAPVTTDAQGAFLFTDLAPGKYKLAAKGVIHNKTRKTEQEVTIESGAANAKPVQLILK